MSQRLEKFHSFKTHPYHGKDFKKLTKIDLVIIEDFILKNDSLSKDDFAEKANRWGLDQTNRPKNHVVLWSFIFQSNC